MAPANYSDYKELHVELRSNGVLVATLDGADPEKINLMTMTLFADIDRLTKQVEADDSVKVFIVRSASPVFWIAHFDVGNMLQIKTDKPAKKFDKVKGIQAISDRIRNMGKPTIAEVAGRLGGGGCELAMGFDMRFGVLGSTFVSNQEVGLGALAGGGGTVNWPQIVGRNRAMEVLLGCVDLDASMAEKWGWLNRAFPTRESCTSYVDWIADRMAALPAQAVRNTKHSINYGIAHGHNRDDALCEEQFKLQELLRLPENRVLLERFMKNGGQTYKVESQPDALIASKL